MNKKLPCIRCDVRPSGTDEWFRASILVDSGASVTLIDRDSRLLDVAGCEIRPSRARLQGFDGSTTAAAGEITVIVKDNSNNQLRIQSLIARINGFDIILG